MPEDHLSLLLGFTAVLILREQPKAASAFFAAHAAGWLPAFSAALRARTDADFYRTAADVLDAVCEIEKTLRSND